MKTAKRGNDRVITEGVVVVKEGLSKKGNVYTMVSFEDENGAPLFTTFDRDVVKSFLLCYYQFGGKN